ncbi:hypothetical protein ACNKHR_17345 [Shigella flexneri]
MSAIAPGMIPYRVPLPSISSAILVCRSRGLPIPRPAAPAIQRNQMCYVSVAREQP